MVAVNSSSKTALTTKVSFAWAKLKAKVGIFSIMAASTKVKSVTTKLTEKALTLTHSKTTNTSESGLKMFHMATASKNFRTVPTMKEHL